jgi:hypothetical protein
LRLKQAHSIANKILVEAAPCRPLKVRRSEAVMALPQLRRSSLMSKFKYTPDEDDADRAYVLVDDIFDISLLRTEEGLIIDVYEKTEEIELLGTLALENPCHEEE